MKTLYYGNWFESLLLNGSNVPYASDVGSNPRGSMVKHYADSNPSITALLAHPTGGKKLADVIRITVILPADIMVKAVDADMSFNSRKTDNRMNNQRQKQVFVRHKVESSDLSSSSKTRQRFETRRRFDKMRHGLKH